MPDSAQLTYRPSTSARVLIFVVCLVVAQPVALVAAGIVTWSSEVSASNYLVALGLFAPLAIGLAVWIVKHQSICIDTSSAVFSFTRYALPRTRQIVYTEVAAASYLGGVLGVDNRPRPLLEFSTRSGEQFWVPLSIYTRMQIQDLVGALETRGVKFAGDPLPRRANR